MAGEAARSGGDWCAGRGSTRPATSPTRAAAKKWSTASVLAALLLAVVVVSVWIAWHFIHSSKPNPRLVAFWVSEFQRRSGTVRADVERSRLSSLIPPIPWVEADRKALEESQVFQRTETRADQTWMRDVMETQLHALRWQKPSEAVVVYIASYATVDEDGKVHILAYDSDPFQPKTLLSLSAVLSALKDCPSRQKLLVLDVFRNTADPFDLGGPSEGLAELVRKELQSAEDPAKLNDPDLLVIGSCDSDQTSLGSETLGQSVFGHFFRLGLTTQEADTNRDRVITVGELAGFLKGKVLQWTEHYRGIAQRPFLAGSVPKDFPLAALARQAPLTFSWPWKKSSTLTQSGPSNPPPEKTTEKEKSPEKVADKGKDKEKAGSDEIATDSDGRTYPEWLTGGWTLRDQWYKANEFLASPRAFLRLEAILLRAEQCWRNGAVPRPSVASCRGN